MKGFKWAASFLVLASLSTAASAHDASRYAPSPRQTFNFNPGWLSQTGDPAGAAEAGFSDSGWAPVTLPNAFNEKEAFSRDITALTTGIVWYRKHFALPRGWKGGRAFLEFEGVRQAAEVWVNGRRVALSESGVTAFGADITDALSAGDNVVAVRVDNDWAYKERATGSHFQWNDKNFNVNYGGITKNVKLHLTGPVYQTLPLQAGLGTTGQYVWADAFDIPGRAATIHAETEVRNADATPRTLRYEVAIRDRQGRIVGRAAGGTVTLARARRGPSPRNGGSRRWISGAGAMARSIR